MLRMHRAGTAIALAALLAAGAAAAEDAGLAEDAADLGRLLDGVASFRANFEQTVMNPYGDVLQVASGSMLLQRPARLRWEVREPYPQLVLADGDSLWVLDPDLDQVTVQPLAAAVEGSPAVFLAGVGEDEENGIAEHFDVIRAEPPAGAAHRYVLQPRDPDALFRDLTLTFAADGALQGLDIVDHLEQITRIEFADAQVNPELAPGAFAFEIPPGVDVIGNVPPAAAADR